MRTLLAWRVGWLMRLEHIQGSRCHNVGNHSVMLGPWAYLAFIRRFQPWEQPSWPGLWYLMLLSHFESSFETIDFVKTSLIFSLWNINAAYRDFPLVVLSEPLPLSHKPELSPLAPLLHDKEYLCLVCLQRVYSIDTLVSRSKLFLIVDLYCTHQMLA